MLTKTISKSLEFFNNTNATSAPSSKCDGQGSIECADQHAVGAFFSAGLFLLGCIVWALKKYCTEQRRHVAPAIDTDEREFDVVVPGR